MEVVSLKHRPALRGPTPLLRLQGDERLVALTRRGNQSAYEVLVARYESRLLGFCRHMLASKEDAEDVLQEVFAAAFNAMVADDRPINVRPWLYRIARNRSLNHLRKQTAIGVDSMDVHLAEHGITTADKVHEREEFRQLVGDVRELPEQQRSALLLREIDALSYDQIAQAMETTVPAVKSLLVRARVGWPRPPRPARSPATRSATSSARSPRACAASPRPCAATSAAATAARASRSSSRTRAARSPRCTPSGRCCF
jgi:RNA polymerase sigma factor (sigma-70 family)